MGGWLDGDSFTPSIFFILSSYIPHGYIHIYTQKLTEQFFCGFKNLDKLGTWRSKPKLSSSEKFFLSTQSSFPKLVRTGLFANFIVLFLSSR